MTCPKNGHAITLFLFFLFLFIFTADRGGSSREFTVGGSTWAVPTRPDPPSFYNDWAERNRFQINDSIVFNYGRDQDSVLRVDQGGYTDCNTSVYMESFSDGHTVFTLTSAGPFFFISGVRDRCLKDEKLIVVVLAERGNRTGGSHSAPPSPAPAQTPIPAPTGEVGPGRSPDQEPKNSASSSLTTCIGAVVAAFALALINF